MRIAAQMRVGFEVRLPAPNEIGIGIAERRAQEQPTRMLRITVVESSANAITLRVEGRIAGPWLEELRRTCEAHWGTNSAKRNLEVEDIGFVDDAGVTYLKELKAQGVGLIRVSPFLTELFKSDSSRTDAGTSEMVRAKRRKPRLDRTGR